MDLINIALKNLYAIATYMDGAPFFLIGGFLGYCISYKCVNLLNSFLRITTCCCAILFLFLVFCYLIYPGYFAALESSIANLGIIFNQGGDIYPALTDYTYHGLPYGPFLAEVQSIFQFQAFDPILTSKVSGTVAFLTSIAIILYVIRDKASRYYLILILPFGSFLFSNRPDSFLILMTVFAILLMEKCDQKNILLMMVVGALSGFAAAFKMHGFFYVLGAAVALNRNFPIKIKTILFFGAASLIAFLLTFLPQQASLVQFIGYLKLASLHGLDIKMLLENILYFLIISAPVLYILLRKYFDNGVILWNINAFLMIEVLVAIVGAKPGAGTHHLLPFIPINALILQNLSFSSVASPKLLTAFKFSLVFVLMGPVLVTELQFFRAMLVHYQSQKASAADLYQIVKKYPDAILVPSDGANYSLVLLNPILEKYSINQPDIPGYMDLNLSGISDSMLSEKIKKCDFSYILTPKFGIPFSIYSAYFQSYLFSEDLRNAFLSHYEIFESHGNYSVYKCANKN
jgi:hypothetical protein